MGTLTTVVVNKDEYLNYLDDLVETTRYNWQVWADHLRNQFAELSKEEAEKVVLSFLSNYVEQLR